MFSPRIIPVLLCKRNRLVKSEKFKKYTYIGDPINAVKIFNELKVDELVILDIEASYNKKIISLELVKEVCEEANMPFSIGGGINNIFQIEERLKIGAEKVILNTAAFNDINFIFEAVKNFGSSTISVCVDIKKDLFGRYRVYSHSNSRYHKRNYFEYIKDLQDAGVGELIIQSVDRDGTMIGYDYDLYKTICEEIKVPIIALGGAESIENIKSMWDRTSINSFAAASLFIYFGKQKSVLINYPIFDRKSFYKKFDE